MAGILSLLTRFWFITFPVLILGVFVVYYFYRQWRTVIYNVAMFFRKGGSIEEHNMKIRAGAVEFTPDESRVIVPIIAQPKMRIKKGRMERVFLIKEGTGATIEVLNEEELSSEQLETISSIIEELSEEGIETSTLGSTKYLNFNVLIDPETEDDSMNVAFATGMSSYSATQDFIMSEMAKMETSKWTQLFLIMGGGLIGFFMAYALALKGVI